MENTSTEKKGLGKWFPWFHATSVNGTAMAIAATIATYFSLYAQEEIGVTAAQLSVIMLICSLWDAINDPLMGLVCDTVNLKHGRYRTWFTFTPVLLLIDMFLLFSNPGFIQNSATAKCIYVCACYMFYGMIVTAYTMPQMAILPAMTLDDDERNAVVGKGAACMALAFTIASTFSTQLVEIFGSYRRLMCFYAIFSIVSFWGLYKTSEERYVLPKDPDNSGLKPLVYVFRHKEMWALILVWCLASISYGFMFSSSVYYAQYIFVPKLVDFVTMSEDQISSTISSTISVYMGVVSVGALVSMAVLMPMLLKKFKVGYKVMIISQVCTIALYLVLYFVGEMNFILCCVLSFIATAAGAMVNGLTNVLVNDAIDFIMLKEGKQLSGIISSVKGFSFKCGTTITSSGLLAVLAAAGFDAQNGIFDQGEAALTAVNICRFLLPAGVSVVILIIAIFYPVKKYFPAIAEMKAKMAAEQK